MAEDLEIPIGFHYYLSDRKAIKYLESKVSDPLFQLPNEILQGYHLYGEYDPWTLPFEDGAKDKDRDQYLYFFTTLKRKSKNKIERTAGSGTWNGQRTEKIYGKGKVQKVIIGLKKTFDFELITPDPRKEWQYIMHEFSQLKYGGDSVICRIRRKRPVGYTEEQQRLASLKRTKPAAVHEEPAAIAIHEEPAAIAIHEELPLARHGRDHVAGDFFQAAVLGDQSGETAWMNLELNSGLATSTLNDTEDFEDCERVMSMLPPARHDCDLVADDFFQAAVLGDQSGETAWMNMEDFERDMSMLPSSSSDNLLNSGLPTTPNMEAEDFGGVMSMSMLPNWPSSDNLFMNSGLATTPNMEAEDFGRVMSVLPNWPSSDNLF